MKLITLLGFLGLFSISNSLQIRKYENFNHHNEVSPLNF